MKYTKDNIHMVEFKHKDEEATIYWYNIIDKKIYWKNSRHTIDGTGNASYSPSHVIERLNNGTWIPIKQEVTYDIY